MPNNSSKSPRPLTSDDRLVHIPYQFRHTSATLGWHELRVDHDRRQPTSDFVHPPLECLMLVLTGKIFPEHTDHRCDDARYNGDGLPHAMNLLPPGVESRWRWRNTLNYDEEQRYD
jgi:AraC family transcriptional regulator